MKHTPSRPRLFRRAPAPGAALVLAFVLAAALAPSVRVAAVDWGLTTGTGSWDVNTNWNGNTVPTVGGTAVINKSGTAVAGAGVSATVADIHIGTNDDRGTLLVNGGTLTATTLVRIGREAEKLGHGNVTVSDASLLATAALSVGYNGTGTLSLLGTGSVTASGETNIGHNNVAASGRVTIGDSASLQTNGLFVGRAGAGTLTLTGGARVTNSGTAYIGYGTNSVSSTVTVSGSALWENTGALTIAASGTGTLDIAGTGTVTNAAATLGNAAGSHGTVTGSGNGVWQSTGNLIIGNSGTGVLDLSGDASVTNTGNATLGYGTNTGYGSGTLSGNARWASTGILVVGENGTGTLALSVTASATAASIRIGNGTTGRGDVTVGGTAGLQIGNRIDVGNNGTGTLHITDSGTVINNDGNINIGGGGGGTLRVSGNGVLTTPVTLYAGNSGTGTLILEDNALVTAAGAFVADKAGSSGTLTVSGGTLAVTNLTVANNGTGTLSLTGSGRITATGAVTIGNSATATGDGAATVDGNALLQITGNLVVGASGTGALTIAGTGTVTNAAATLGSATNSRGTVTGSDNGVWKSTGTLIVGNSGTGVLDLSGNVTVTSTDATLGSGATGHGSGTLSGNARWTSTGTLVIGGSGTGSLDLSGDATVTTAAATLGNAAGSRGTVTGSGNGVWQSTGTLVVGGYGTGTLTLSAAASATAASIRIAENASGRGDVTVGGTAVLQSGDGLSIGHSGNGTLHITDSGTVINNAGNTNIGSNASGVGTLTVSGNGVLKTPVTLYAGNSGTGTLILEDNALVTAATAIVADKAGSSGTLTVSGGTLAVTNLTVAGNGTGTLSLTGSGRITTTGAVTIGNSATATGTGAATVDGNALLQITGNLVVGASGTGALTIAGSGTVTNADATLGNAAGSRGTVTGTGNGVWQSTGNLVIGNSGTGVLDLSGDASVTNTGNATLGYGANTGYGSGTLSGNARWASTGNLVVGSHGTGTLALYAAASATAASVRIAENTAGRGDITVGGTAVLQSGNTINVGQSGAGTLHITDSGTVINNVGNTNIGSGTGSTGTLRVSGSGVFLNTSTSGGTLYAGNNGTGTLILEDDAFVAANTVIIADKTGSSGTLALRGGVLEVTGNIRASTNSTTPATAIELNGGAVRSKSNAAQTFFQNVTGALTIGPAGFTFEAAGNGAITIGQSLSAASGTFTKTGPGALYLNGNPANYHGTFNVASGTLRLDSRLASDATLANAARLIIRHTAGTSGTIAAAITQTPGAILELNLDDATHTLNLATTIAAGALYKTGAGTLVLTAPQSYAGLTSILNGTLRISGAGAFSPNSVHRLEPNTTLAIDTSATLGAIDNHAGRIRYGASAAGLTLTLDTLTGAGFFDLNLNLADGIYDRLVVTGSATGAHTLQLTVLGGPPANPAAIDAVDIVTAAAGDAAFASNDIEFEGGMYGYALVQGDPDDPRRPDPGKWYFSNNGHSRAAAAILSTAGALAADWHHSLDNLRLRLGEFHAGAGGDTGAGDTWLRIGAYHLDAGPRLAGVPFEQDTFNLAAGMDRAFTLDDSRLLAGAYVTTGRSARDHGAGTESTTGDTGLGLYLTWAHADGWYADLTGRLDTYVNSLTFRSTAGETTGARYDSQARGVSLEIGSRRAYGKFWTELSGQAAFVWLDGADYDTRGSTYDVKIRVSDSAAAQYRLQFRAGADLGRWQPYVKIGKVRNEAIKHVLVRVDGDLFEPFFEGWRLETGAGVSWRFDGKNLLYLDYDYNKSDLYERPWAVSLGFRHPW
jgi:outer membrane autotransporter protein